MPGPRAVGLPVHDSPYLCAGPRSGQRQDVHHRLTLGPHCRGGDPLPELRPGQRVGGGQRGPHGGHRPVRVLRRYALLRQPAGVPSTQLRGGQRMQPPVVLGADQVQGAAIQPGDDQRAPRERGIDVRGGQSRRTRPDRKPRATGLLCLDGQQPPSDLLGAARRVATEQFVPRSAPRSPPDHRDSRQPVTLKCSPAATLPPEAGSRYPLPVRSSAGPGLCSAKIAGIRLFRPPGRGRSPFVRSVSLFLARDPPFCTTIALRRSLRCADISGRSVLPFPVARVAAAQADLGWSAGLRILSAHLG